MNFVGKVCPYCKTEFKEEDEVVICSDCEMPHHKECWIQNQACTTFGCTGTIMGADNYNNDLSCTKCGVVYRQGEKFCSTCGNLLLKSEQQLQYDYYSQQQQSLNYNQFQHINQTSSVNYGQPNTNDNAYNTTNIDADMQVFIGKNQDYYFKKFQKFNIKNGKVSWNFASAFLGAYWYAYRKMYLIQFLYYVIYIFTVGFLGVLIAGLFSKAHISTLVVAFMPFLILFIPCVISGIFGNYIYKSHVERHVQIARYMDAYMKQNYLMKKGGTSGVAVFVLIGIGLLLRIISVANKHPY